ncbi:MAG: UrcA family protein [Phenylobacterium sp.]
MNRTTCISLTIAGFCLTAIVQPAAGQPYVLKRGFSFDPTQVVTYASVPHADLDPTTAAGTRELLQRIEAAADAVCGGAANQTTRAARDAYEDCRHIAVSGAVAKVRSPALTQLAETRRMEQRAAW